MRQSLVSVFCVLVGVAAPALPASAVEKPSGQIVGYSSYATILGADGEQGGEIGGPIYSGDKIRTNSSGRVELLFVDKTKLVVGPNSLLSIDDFVLSNQNTAKSVSIEAVRGAFRFITGNSPKQAYDLKTPTATIGIRGTSFDFSVTGQGQTAIALFTGQLRMCGVDRRCVDLRDACSVGVVDPTGGARQVANRPDRNQVLRDNFPFVVDQGPLRQDFRAATGSCGDIGLATPPRDNAPTFQFGSNSPFSAPNNPPPNNPPPNNPPPGDNIGNPGNGGSNGNAGSSPGGNDMGSPGQGRSDNNGGGGGGGGGNSDNAPGHNK